MTLKDVFDQYEEINELQQAESELWTLHLNVEDTSIKTTLSPVLTVSELVKKLCKKNFPNIKDPEQFGLYKGILCQLIAELIKYVDNEFLDDTKKLSVYYKKRVNKTVKIVCLFVLMCKLEVSLKRKEGEGSPGATRLESSGTASVEASPQARRNTNERLGLIGYFG